jgi:hypothetical protein
MEMMESKLIKVYQYSLNSKTYDWECFELYTRVTDKGEYPLSRSGGVFFLDCDHENLKPTGIPHCTCDELFIMEYDGVLGLYDDNFKLFKEYDNLWDLNNDIADNYEDRVLTWYFP